MTNIQEHRERMMIETAYVTGFRKAYWKGFFHGFFFAVLSATLGLVFF